MNESDYARLAASCDRWLRAPGTDDARLAIGFLHLVHEHPSWLAQYRRLFEPDAIPMRDRPLVRGARDLFRMTRGLGRAIRPHTPRAAPETSARPLDVLVVSRLHNDSQLTLRDDFYFGDLPRRLRERGLRVLVALVDHRLDPGSREPETDSARFLLPRSLTPRAEMALWKHCAAARVRLWHDSESARDELDRATARVAAELALAAGTAANLRLQIAVRDLCSRLRPRMVLTTFEGDASERMIFLATRQSGAAPLCVGYQHTRLLPRAHAVRRALENPALPADPDVVLALGAETQALLESVPRAARCILYGSHRRVAAKSSLTTAPRSSMCLVLPDAEPGEYALMLEFTVACAKHAADVQFVFRPHPASTTARRRAQGLISRDWPPNLRIDGEDSLERQAASARSCLYRASSAALQATLFGARPLFLARPGELHFDPLGAMPGSCTVMTPADVAHQARGAGWENSPLATAAWQYCDRYFPPVRGAALDELLSLVYGARRSRSDASGFHDAQR